MDPEPLIRGLERDGIHVTDGFLDAAHWRALAAICPSRALVPAAIGRAGSRQLESAIRGDRTAWLAADDQEPAVCALLRSLDDVRIALNQALLLNLAEFEAHFAHYAPGARYARHRDAFRDDAARVVSAVIYLNEDWRGESDGGALRVHLADGTWRDIEPRGGRAAFFLSAEFDHEVLPATRDRFSVAAWFRRRGRD